MAGGCSRVVGRIGISRAACMVSRAQGCHHEDAPGWEGGPVGSRQLSGAFRRASLVGHGKAYLNVIGLLCFLHGQGCRGFG